MVEEGTPETQPSSDATREPRAPESVASCKAIGIAVHFEGIKAVDQVDLEIRVGDVHGLIGPNGAGKTTLVNAISGFQAPTAGRVELAGVDVTDYPPHRRAAAGLARTFQGGRSFPDLTVFENVEVAAPMPASAPVRRSPSSASGIERTPSPNRSPRARSGGFRSPARLRCARGSCSWTSRRRG